MFNGLQINMGTKEAKKLKSFKRTKEVIEEKTGLKFNNDPSRTKEILLVFFKQATKKLPQT